MQMLTVKQVAAKLACSESYVWKLMKQDPTFPKGIRIGLGGDAQRATRLEEQAINEWLVKRIHKENDDETGRIGAGVHRPAEQEVSA
jgi:predicted DNA-binding transcriptional regulator AlpA